MRLLPLEIYVFNRKSPPQLFWLTLTTYVYKAIQTLGRKMTESSTKNNPLKFKYHVVYIILKI